MKIDKLVVDGEDLTEKVVSASFIQNSKFLNIELSNYKREIQKSAEDAFKKAAGIEII